MRAALLLTPAAFLAACSVPTVYLRAHTTEAARCVEENVAIVGEPPSQGRGDFQWEARCGERTFRCEQALRDNVPVIGCEQTGGPVLEASEIPEEEAEATAVAGNDADPDQTALIAEVEERPVSRRRAVGILAGGGVLTSIGFPLLVGGPVLFALDFEEATLNPIATVFTIAGLGMTIGGIVLLVRGVHHMRRR